MSIDDDRWTGPAMAVLTVALPGALALAPKYAPGFSGPPDLPLSGIGGTLFQLGMLPAFLWFLFDLARVNPSKIRKAGIAPSSWERSSNLTWELSGAFLLLMGIPVTLFWAYIRRRLLQLRRQIAGLPGEAYPDDPKNPYALAFATTIIVWIFYAGVVQAFAF